MIPTPDILARRIADLEAWCAAWPEGLPGDVCWSPELRPWRSPIRPPWSVIAAGWRGEDVPLEFRVTLIRYRAGSMANLFAAEASDMRWHIDRLARDRASILRAANLRPETSATSLLGGRLLLYCRDDNLADRAAEVQTDGFFDTDNVPAWDTWLCDDAAPSDRRAREHCLVAWIPPSHVELVDRGVRVNPESCIRWADSSDSPEEGSIYGRVIDQLMAGGWLRRSDDGGTARSTVVSTVHPTCGECHPSEEWRITRSDPAAENSVYHA